VPHGLDEAVVKDLRTKLPKVHGLGAAVLVRKVIDDPEFSIYVLGVLASFTWKDGRSDKHTQPLVLRHFKSRDDALGVVRKANAINTVG
jgi:hypothetical protein